MILSSQLYFAKDHIGGRFGNPGIAATQRRVRRCAHR